MKAHVKIWLTLLGLAMATISYGQCTALNEVYKYYSGKEGVEEVLVTSKMISMMIASQENSSPDAKQLSQNLKEIHILSNQSGIAFSPSLDMLKKELEKCGYEKLMQLSEKNESVSIYMLESKDGKIQSFVMLSKDSKEEVILDIEGNMTMHEVLMASDYMNIKLDRVMNFR